MSANIHIYIDINIFCSYCFMIFISLSIERLRFRGKYTLIFMSRSSRPTSLKKKKKNLSVIVTEILSLYFNTNVFCTLLAQEKHGY